MGEVNYTEILNTVFVPPPPPSSSVRCALVSAVFEPLLEIGRRELDLSPVLLLLAVDRASTGSCRKTLYSLHRRCVHLEAALTSALCLLCCCVGSRSCPVMEEGRRRRREERSAKRRRGKCILKGESHRNKREHFHRSFFINSLSKMVA